MHFGATRCTRIVCIGFDTGRHGTSFHTERSRGFLKNCTVLALYGCVLADIFFVQERDYVHFSRGVQYVLCIYSRCSRRSAFPKDFRPLLLDFGHFCNSTFREEVSHDIMFLFNLYLK